MQDLTDPNPRLLNPTKPLITLTPTPSSLSSPDLNPSFNYYNDKKRRRYHVDYEGESLPARGVNLIKFILDQIDPPESNHKKPRTLPLTPEDIPKELYFTTHWKAGIRSFYFNISNWLKEEMAIRSSTTTRSSNTAASTPIGSGLIHYAPCHFFHTSTPSSSATPNLITLQNAIDHETDITDRLSYHFQNLMQQQTDKDPDLMSALKELPRCISKAAKAWKVSETLVRSNVEAYWRATRFGKGGSESPYIIRSTKDLDQLSETMKMDTKGLCSATAWEIFAIWIAPTLPNDDRMLTKWLHHASEIFDNLSGIRFWYYKRSDSPLGGLRESVIPRFVENMCHGDLSLAERYTGKSFDMYNFRLFVESMHHQICIGHLTCIHNFKRCQTPTKALDRNIQEAIINLACWVTSDGSNGRAFKKFAGVWYGRCCAYHSEPCVERACDWCHQRILIRLRLEGHTMPEVRERPRIWKKYSPRVWSESKQLWERMQFCCAECEFKSMDQRGEIEAYRYQKHSLQAEPPHTMREHVITWEISSLVRDLNDPLLRLERPPGTPHYICEPPGGWTMDMIREGMGWCAMCKVTCMPRDGLPFIPGIVYIPALNQHSVEAYRNRTGISCIVGTFYRYCSLECRNKHRSIHRSNRILESRLSDQAFMQTTGLTPPGRDEEGVPHKRRCACERCKEYQRGVEKDRKRARSYSH